MKHIILLILASLLIAGCKSNTQAEIIDNGKPGQIKVTTYLDGNRNGLRDQGEGGLVERVGISQDRSCPATDMKKITGSDTNASGEAVFSELKPGHYCISYMGDRGSTSKLTLEVDLSSEQQIQAFFGLSE